GTKMKSRTTRLWNCTSRSFVAVALATAVAAPTVIRAAGERDSDDHERRHDDHRDGDDSKAIEHVVVIFQENVSFDHYFATYPNAANTTPGEPVFNAADDTPSVNGLLSAGLRTHNPNSTQPFRLSRAQAITCDQDHSYTDEQKSFNSGLMNLFPETVGVGAGTCFD